MVRPTNIVDSFRDLPDDTREAIGSYWRNLREQNQGAPLGFLCDAWCRIIAGDVEGAELALSRVVASGDSEEVAQAYTALALLHESDSERAAKEYAHAAVDRSATFAKYKQAEGLRGQGRLAEAEFLLKEALANIEESDLAGLQFIASEYVSLLVALDRRDEARALLRDLIERYPDIISLRRQAASLENAHRPPPNS